MKKKVLNLKRKSRRPYAVSHATGKATDAYLAAVDQRSGVPEFPPKAFCAVAEASQAAFQASIDEHFGTPFG